jgi:hypothetical protein
MIVEHCKQLKTPAYLAFVDLQKAFDRVNRATLWHVLSRELGMEGDLLGQI